MTMEERFTEFIEEGTALLAQIKHSHELSAAKEESANQRIKLIQWIIVVILAPTMLTSGVNSVTNARQMDAAEIYQLFPTKERVFNLERSMYYMYQDKFQAAADNTTIATDEEFHRILQQFIGDTSRGEQKEWH